jgi:hypothetical protein
VELAADQEELANLSESFIVELRADRREVPDALRQEIDCFARNRKELESEGDFVNTKPPIIDDSDDDSSVMNSNCDDGFRACDVDFRRDDDDSDVDEDEDEMAVKWSSDHDWSILENDYGENDRTFDEMSKKYTDVSLGSGAYSSSNFSSDFRRSRRT